MRYYRNIQYLLCFIFLWTTSSSVCQSRSYGLGFTSHETILDERTSLDLTPDKQFNFDQNFDLSFDLSFFAGHWSYFGYIVRVIENDKRNIDFVYDFENHVFRVIIGNKISNIAFPINNDALFSQWNNIRIRFDLDNDKLIVFSDKTSFTQTGMHFEKNGSFRIMFGTNRYKKFQTTDVPPMKVKDIRISEKGVLTYHWPLNEASGLIAHELIAKKDGAVKFPVWMVAQHYNWTKARTLTANGAASVAFEDKSEMLYIAGDDSVYRVNVNNAVVEKYAAAIGHLNQGNQAFYSKNDQRFYDVYIDQRFVAGYDPATKKWDKPSVAALVTSFWQFNKFFSPQDTSLYILGGYGQEVYRNTVQRYNIHTHTWQVIQTHGDFTPRYLAALGANAAGDTAYVLGGYGSTTGKQIVNPRNLYDMMRFTVKDRTFKKMFELNGLHNKDLVFANSLVIDEATKNYYGLVFAKNKFNSSLQLLTGSLLNNSYKLVGDTIPFIFRDTRSFADLHYFPKSKMFVAVTLQRLDNSQTLINVYTLLGPPYNKTDVAPRVEQEHTSFLWFLIVPILAAAGIGFYVFKPRKKAPEPIPETPVVNVPDTLIYDQPVAVEENTAPEPTPEQQQLKNTILLFGDLHVFDAEGIDITKLFSPLVKEMFLVILLYSVRWGRGVSTEKLNEMFWYDMNARDARNNRSVNISKLKNLLERLTFCHLSNETGYWKMDIDFVSIYVDYYRFLSIKDKKNLDRGKILELTEIAQYGSFLSNIEYEWLDSFKSDIYNSVMDTYTHFFGNGGNASADPAFKVELANFIFHFDAVNEDALILKCKALVQMGKHSLAKNAFEAFRKDHRQIYGEEFNTDFNSILE